MVSVSRMSGVSSSSYATPFISSGVAMNDYVNPLGGTFGAYYDFMKIGPIKLGVDARGSILTTKRGALSASAGYGARISSGLGGVRGTFHAYKALDGYVQASAGLGRSNFGLLDPGSLQKGVEYHAFAGMQLHVLPYADFRVFEVGYGGIEAGSHNYPLKSVSTGVVFHFPTAQ